MADGYDMNELDEYDPWFSQLSQKPHSTSRAAAPPLRAPFGCIVTTCYGPLREQGAGAHPRHSCTIDHIRDEVMMIQAKIDLAMIARVK